MQCMGIGPSFERYKYIVITIQFRHVSESEKIVSIGATSLLATDIGLPHLVVKIAVRNDTETCPR